MSIDMTIICPHCGQSSIPASDLVRSPARCGNCNEMVEVKIIAVPIKPQSGEGTHPGTTQNY